MSWTQIETQEHPNGEFVLYADYARLKAEVDGYSKVVSTAHADLFSEYARLQAEVERLRKAGDAMHRAIKVSDPFLDWAIECWLAAKEGKPSV